MRLPNELPNESLGLAALTFPPQAEESKGNEARGRDWGRVKCCPIRFAPSVACANISRHSK